MERVSSLKYRWTSVTLREASRRRFQAALRILRRNGVEWSESELLRRLAKTYLRHWRGRGVSAVTGRRYNVSIRGEKYVRMAWYIDQMLSAILSERALHSGESISRMLDFAIRHYLPRLIEEILRAPMPGCTRAARNQAYWLSRYLRRHKPQSEIFITYQSHTHENSPKGLKYTLEYQILTKSELFRLEFPY